MKTVAQSEVPASGETREHQEHRSDSIPSYPARIALSTSQDARRLLFGEAKARLRERLRSVNWQYQFHPGRRATERHRALSAYRQRVALILAVCGGGAPS